MEAAQARHPPPDDAATMRRLAEQVLELEHQLAGAREEHERSARLLAAAGRRLEEAGRGAEATEVYLRLTEGRRAMRPRLVPEAPAVPAGWRIGPPDFVGLGVQRCGTSWWFRQLASHPDVFRPRRKEVHFFDSLAFGALAEDEVAAYHRWFPRPDAAEVPEWARRYEPEPDPRRPRARLTGEWTPRYLLDPFTPRLLAQAAPQTKLLAILRDPVERYRSQLSWTDARPKGARGRIDVATATNAIHHGHYHQQLMSVLRHFPRENLLVLQYEACRARPDEQLERTYAFVGADPAFRPPRPEDQVNVKFPQTELDPGVREELVEMYTPGARALARDFPEIDLSLWPNFREAG